MNTKYKIIATLSIAVILASAVLVGNFQYKRIADAVYLKTQNDVVDYVTRRAPSLSTPEDFSTQDSARQITVFKNLFEGIRTNGLFRIKVFNTNHVIIWTNQAENIGIRNTKSELLRNALQGIPGLELKELKGAEHVGELVHYNFLEVFVPIKDPSGKIVGVIEAYQDTESEKNQIMSEFLKWAIGLGILAVLLSIVIIIIGRKMSTAPDIKPSAS